MPYLFFILFTLLSTSAFSTSISPKQLYSELQQIRQDYAVPGLSVTIAEGGVTKPVNITFEHYAGTLSVDSKKPITKNTYFPIASLTKAFSSHLLMSLANANKLSLQDPIQKWVPGANLPESLTIKDLLSHTLTGGENRGFFYDYRFGMLTSAIKNAGKEPFEKQLTGMIAREFMTTGLMPYTEAATADIRASDLLAVSHRFEGKSVPADHDYGLSASAGLVATNTAMINVGGHLMARFKKRDSGAHVFDKYQQSTLYANGFFRQRVAGHLMYWGYGQYDGIASLWLIVPEKELQLVMFANNNVLSDASRLIFGDATASPITNLFVGHYLCKEQNCDTNYAKQRARLHRDVYFSRYDKSSFQSAIKGFKALYPNQAAWQKRADLNAVHLSNYLFIVSVNLDYPRPEWSKRKLEFIEANLKAQTNNRPYWLFYTGMAYLRMGMEKETSRFFSELTDITNMPNHWTINEANNLLKSH